MLRSTHEKSMMRANNARTEMLKESKRAQLLGENLKAGKNQYGQFRGHLRAFRRSVGCFCDFLEQELLDSDKPVLTGDVYNRVYNTIDEMRAIGAIAPHDKDEIDYASLKVLPQMLRKIEETDKPYGDD